MIGRASLANIYIKVIVLSLHISSGLIGTVILVAELNRVVVCIWLVFHPILKDFTSSHVIFLGCSSSAICIN